MFARTLDGICRPERLDAVIEHTQGAWLQLRPTDGFLGLSLIADRATGRCITTSAWQSEDAWHAAVPILMPMVAAGLDIGGAKPEEALRRSWDVAAMHRNHRSGSGACTRVTWSQGAPADLDQWIPYFRDTVIPNLEDLDGFCSTSLFVNRTTGASCLTTSYDSPAAMSAAREAANRIRSVSGPDFTGRIQDVAEFELCLAHLHVPELV